MILKAYMLTFWREEGPCPVREIDISADFPSVIEPLAAVLDDSLRNSMLESAFKWGQNDFQPRQIPSLSVGDVVELPDRSLHIVGGIGWVHLPKGSKIEDLPRGVEARFVARD